MRLPAQRQVGRTEVDGNVGPREMVATHASEDRIRLIGRLPDTPRTHAPTTMYQCTHR